MVNRDMRARRWPAGESEEMRKKGWELLEYMAWPLAWFSRKLHAVLKYIPGYTPLVKWWVRSHMRRILDFGCGHGTTVLELRFKDTIDIIGLDPYSPTTHPHIVAATLQQARFPSEAFDGIFSIETVEHIPNVLDTFRELYRILKPGGVLLIQTRRLEDPDYTAHKGAWFYLREPKTHVSIFSERAFQTIAKKVGFSTVQFRGVRLARLIK